MEHQLIMLKSKSLAQRVVSPGIFLALSASWRFNSRVKCVKIYTLQETRFAGTVCLDK
jgi:hypothetical protein